MLANLKRMLLCNWHHWVRQDFRYSCVCFNIHIIQQLSPVEVVAELQKTI